MLLLGGGFALGHGLVASKLDREISVILDEINNAPLPLLVPLLALVMCIITEFTSNVATASVVLPILKLQVKPEDDETIGIAKMAPIHRLDVCHHFLENGVGKSFGVRPVRSTCLHACLYSCLYTYLYTCLCHVHHHLHFKYRCGSHGSCLAGRPQPECAVAPKDWHPKTGSQRLAP